MFTMCEQVSILRKHNLHWHAKCANFFLTFNVSYVMSADSYLVWELQRHNRSYEERGERYGAEFDVPRQCFIEQ